MHASHFALQSVVPLEVVIFSNIAQIISVAERAAQNTYKLSWRYYSIHQGCKLSNGLIGRIQQMTNTKTNA